MTFGVRTARPHIRQPVVPSSAPLGGDEGVVEQGHLAGLLGSLRQGAVQAQGMGSKQDDQLVPPAADGGRARRAGSADGVNRLAADAPSLE